MHTRKKFFGGLSSAGTATVLMLALGASQARAQITDITSYATGVAGWLQFSNSTPVVIGPWEFVGANAPPAYSQYVNLASASQSVSPGSSWSWSVSTGAIMDGVIST